MTCSTSAGPFFQTLAHRKIPDGEYPGVWGGFSLRFSVNGQQVSCVTRDALPGGPAYVSVQVRGGVATVTTR